MKLSTVEAFRHINTGSTVTLSDKQLLDLQRVLKTILYDIVAVCDENNIVYTLGGGTCLGAVRHHDFIPWDDDIDINMPRADYDRFIPLFTKRFEDKYWIHTPSGNTKGYDLLLSRIRLKGTSVVTREDFAIDEAGAFVDLFVMENTYDNPVLRNLHGVLCNGFGFLVSCRKFYRDRKPLMELARETGDKHLMSTFKFKIGAGFLTAIFSMKAWLRAGDKVNGMCHDGNSKYVVAPTGRKHFWGEMYLRRDICETVDVMYDNRALRCPGDTDLYLRNLYGDYMKLPDMDDLEKHVFFAPFSL